jgi:hypothetical protein
MNQRRPVLPKLLFATGPAGAILVAYMALFHAPIKRSLDAEAIKLNKTVSITNRFDLESDKRQLDELKSELRELTSQSDALKKQARFVTQRLGKRQTAYSSPNPAHAMAELLGVFELNGMRLQSCVDADSTETADAKSLVAPSSTTKPAAEGAAGRNFTISLQGTFPELRNALRAIGTLSTTVALVSLEMSEADGLSAIRQWTLTVQV